MLRSMRLMFLAGLLAPSLICAITFQKTIGPHELYAELEDPYYFAAGGYFSFAPTGIPHLETVDERPVYRNLLANMYKPNCLLLETGVYPLPIAGVIAKSYAPGAYSKSVIAGANIIQAITESVNFREPWSLSCFVGHVMDFRGVDSTVQGHGNSGLLATYGYYHIKDNTLYPDHWGEFELKVKVDKRGANRQYATSYRIGTRIHSNSDILDLLYVVLKRDRTDFSETGFSLIRNTNFQIRGDFSYVPWQMCSFTFEGGKKYPFKVRSRTYVLGLSLGLTCNLHNAYAGLMGQGFKANTLSPIIRPLIAF